jgi:hypothetical protein
MSSSQRAPADQKNSFSPGRLIGAARFNGLSIQQKELLLPFLENLKNIAEEDEKQAILLELYTAYRDGYSDRETGQICIQPDEEKANYYLGKAIKQPLPENLMRNALFWFSWFTTIRLGAVRVNREHIQLHPGASPLLSDGFSYLQFSYIPETLVCIALIISKMFKPATAAPLAWHDRLDSKRCTQVIADKDFQNTLSNALVWGVFNIISAAYSLPSLCIFAFAFDIWHDYFYAKKELDAYEDLKNSLGEIAANINNLENKINILKVKLVRVTVVAVGIFIGMALFYISSMVVGLSALGVVGASIAILFGFIIGNCGNRFFKWDDKLVALRQTWIEGKKLDVIGEFLYKALQELVKLFRETIKKLSESPLFVVQLAIAIALTLTGGISALPFIGISIMSMGFFPAIGITVIFLQFITAIGQKTMQLYKPSLTKHELCDLKKVSLLQENPFLGNKKNKSGPQENPYAKLFNELTGEQVASIRQISGLSHEELLSHIATWDYNVNKSLLDPERKCRYSFLNFKRKITATSGSRQNQNNDADYKLESKKPLTRKLIRRSSTTEILNITHILSKENRECLQALDSAPGCNSDLSSECPPSPPPNKGNNYYKNSWRVGASCLPPARSAPVLGGSSRDSCITLTTSQSEGNNLEQKKGSLRKVRQG